MVAVKFPQQKIKGIISKQNSGFNSIVTKNKFQ